MGKKRFFLMCPKNGIPTKVISRHFNTLFWGIPVNHIPAETSTGEGDSLAPEELQFPEEI